MAWHRLWYFIFLQRSQYFQSERLKSIQLFGAVKSTTADGVLSWLIGITYLCRQQGCRMYYFTTNTVKKWLSYSEINRSRSHVAYTHNNNRQIMGQEMTSELTLSVGGGRCDVNFLPVSNLFYAKDKRRVCVFVWHGRSPNEIAAIFNERGKKCVLLH